MHAKQQSKVEFYALSYKVVLFDTSAINMILPQLCVYSSSEASVTITHIQESYLSRKLKIIF